MPRPLRQFTTTLKRNKERKKDETLIGGAFYVGLTRVGENFLAVSVYATAAMQRTGVKKPLLNVQNIINKSISDAKTKKDLKITDYGFAILKSALMITVLSQMKNKKNDTDYLKEVLKKSIYDAAHEFISTELITEIEDEDKRKRKEKIFKTILKTIEAKLDKMFKDGQSLTLENILNNPEQIIEILNQIQKEIIDGSDL